MLRKKGGEKMELKVVISLKDGKATLGVQAPDCDPVFEVFEGSLEEALERVPTLVAEARERWDSNPRYPRTKHELAPASPTPVQSQRTVTAQPRRSSDGVQQSLF